MADDLSRDDLGRHEPGEPADGAEQAFEALRAEVAALRRAVEQRARQGEEGVPDYSPTLGAIAKELKAVSTRLDGIERQPALRMTPAGYRKEIDEVARATAAVASRPYADSLRDAEAVTRELQALAKQVRERREQQRSLAVVGGFGVVGGVLLWLLLIELLPWGAGNWLAALPLGGRWNAGATLLQEDDPVTWRRMLRLYKACPSDSTTDLCEAAMVVRTIPPITPPAPAPSASAPEGARAPASGSVPTRGKAAH